MSVRFSVTQALILNDVATNVTYKANEGCSSFPWYLYHGDVDNAKLVVLERAYARFVAEYEFYQRCRRRAGTASNWNEVRMYFKLLVEALSQFERKI